ncbi:hypothetical protein ALC60_10849 [Trachymyrmex zeteki]|uniref:Ig-like domain-containing protein n=1 Tax=Mycetomoellerius zeteki TaxID=64791 RepID=A0A151WQI8_9HYME|nr:hypothetical protein ALC60_10849 [Trachymyrmex zeteki]
METEIINRPLLDAFERPPSQLDNLDRSVDKAIFPAARQYPNSQRLLDLNASNKNLILSRIASPKSEITVNVQSPAIKGLNNKMLLPAYHPGKFVGVNSSRPQEFQRRYQKDLSNSYNVKKELFSNHLTSSNKRYLLVPVSKNLYVLKNVRESSRTGVDGIIIPKRYKLLEKDNDNATSAILSFKAHMHHGVKDVGRAYLQRGNLHLFDHSMNYLYSTLEPRVSEENPVSPSYPDFLYPDIAFQTDPNLIDVTFKISEEQVVFPVPDYKNISLMDVNLRGRINFYDSSTLSSPFHGKPSTLSAAKLNEVSPIRQNSGNYRNSLEYIFDMPQSREDDPKVLTESNEDESITDFIDDISMQYRAAFDTSANEDNTFFPNITNSFVNNAILNSQNVDKYNQEYGISISSEYNNKVSTHSNDFYYNNRSIDEVLCTNYTTEVDSFLNEEDYVTSAPLLLNTNEWLLKKAQSNVENSNALLMAIKPLSSELQKLLNAIQLVNQSISDVQSRLCDKKEVVGSARTERESKNRNATNITKLIDKVDYYDSDFSTKSFNNQSLDKRRIEIEGKNIAERDVKIRRKAIFLNKLMTPFYKRKSSISDSEVQSGHRNFLKKKKLNEKEFSKSGDRLLHSRFNRNLKSLTKNYETRMKPIRQFIGSKKMKRTTMPILRLSHLIKSDISSENFAGGRRNHQENDQSRLIILPDNTPSLNMSAKKDNSAHFLSDDKRGLTQRNVKGAMSNEISGSGKEKKFHPTDPQFYKEATAYLDILELLGKTENVEYATDVWTTQKLMESLPLLIFTTTEFFVPTSTFLPYFTEAPTITAFNVTSKISEIVSSTRSPVTLSASTITMSTTLSLLYMTELTILSMEEAAISITDLTITVVAIEVTESPITIPMVENFTTESVMLLTPFLEEGEIVENTSTSLTMEITRSSFIETNISLYTFPSVSLFGTTQTELMIKTTTSAVSVLTSPAITKASQIATSEFIVSENITLHKAESTTAIASSLMVLEQTEMILSTETSTITEILFIKTTITEILPINKTVTTAETPTTIETSIASKILMIKTAFTETPIIRKISTTSTIPTIAETTAITETLTPSKIIAITKIPTIKKIVSTKSLTPTITETPSSTETQIITEILTITESLGSTEIPVISTTSITTVFFATSENITSSVTTSPKEFFQTSTLTILTTIFTTETAESILISTTTPGITPLQTLIINTTLSETPCTTISSMPLTTTKGAVTTSFKTAVTTTSLKVTTTTPLSLVTSTMSSEMPNTTLSTFLTEETTASLIPTTASSFETLHTKAVLPISTTISTIETLMTISSILTVNATVFSTTASTITAEILKSTSSLTYFTVTTPSITQIPIKPIVLDTGTTAYETTSTLVTSSLLIETVEGTTSSVIEYEETKESGAYYYETTKEEIATVTSTAKLTTERTTTWITTKEVTIIEETTPMTFYITSFSVETTSEATSFIIETITLPTIIEETLSIEKIVTVTPGTMIEGMSSLSEVILISTETSTMPAIGTSTSTSSVLTTAATTVSLLEETATEITETSLITITTTATLLPTTERPKYATILEAAVTVTLAPFSEFILSIIITSETPVISTLPKTVSEEFTISTTESPSITYVTQSSILVIETTIYPTVSISPKSTEESLEAETEYYVAKEPFYEEEYEEYKGYDTKIPIDRWYYYDEYETTTKGTTMAEKYTKLLKEKAMSPPFIEGTTTSLYKIKTSEFTKYPTPSEAASIYVNVTSTVATSGISYTHIEKVTSISTLETSTSTIVENVTTVKVETEFTASAASKEIESTTMWLTFGSTEEYTLPSSTTFKIPTEPLEYLTIPPKYTDVERFTRIWLVTSPKFTTKPKEIPKIALKKTTTPEQVSETETAVEKLTSFFISSTLTTLPEREIIEVHLTTMSTASSEMEGIIKTAYEVTTSAMTEEETIPSVTPFITSEAEIEFVFTTMSTTVEQEQKERLLQRLDNLKQHEREMAEREERLKEREKQWDIEKEKRRKMMQRSTSVTYATEETIIPYTIEKSTSITHITKETEEIQITDYITLTPYVTTSVMDLYNIGLASIETTTSYTIKETYTVSYVFETPFSITEEIIPVTYTMEKTEEAIEETTFTPYVTEETEEIITSYTAEKSTSITYTEEIEEMLITDYVTFTPYITTPVVDLYSIGLATIETTTPYTVREIYTTSYVTLYSESLFVSPTITSPITLITGKFITLPITTFSERFEEISVTSVTTPTWYTTEETYIVTYTDIYGKPLFSSTELEFTITLSTMAISTTTEKSTMLTSLSTPVPPTERTTIKAQLTTQIERITEKKENRTTKMGITRHTEMKDIEEKKQTYIPEKTVTQEEEEIMTKRVCLNVLENTTIPFDKRRRDIVTRKICLPYFPEKNEEKKSVVYTVNVLHLNYNEDKQTHEVISAKPDEDELTAILFESNDDIYVTEFGKDRKITTPNYKIEEKDEDNEISDKMEKKIEEYNDYIEDLIEDYMNYEEHETSTQTHDGRLLDNRNKDKRMTENEKELLNQTWPIEKSTMYHLGGTRFWKLDFVTELPILRTTTDKSKTIDESITKTTCFDVVLKRNDKIKSNISYYKRHLNNNRMIKHVSIEKRDASLENVTRMNALRYKLRTKQPRVVAKKLKRESQKHEPKHYKQGNFEKKRTVKFNDFRCTSDSAAKNRKLCIANANKLKHQIVKHEDTNKHKKKQLVKPRTSQNLHSLHNTDNGVINKKNAYHKTTTANQYLQVGTIDDKKNNEIKALNCSEYKEIQDKIVISMDSDMEEAREFPQPHYNTESLKGQKYIKLEELEDNLKSNSELDSDNDVISLPGLNLNLPCNQDGNGITWLSSLSRPSYTWKRMDSIALFGFVAENGDLELRNVNAKDTGNYTCVMTYMSPDNEESVETTYEVHLQVVTLPRYIVHGENRYHVRSCDEGDLDVLVTYLPLKLNNIICEADVCNAYVLTPSCTRSQVRFLMLEEKCNVISIKPTYLSIKQTISLYLNLYMNILLVPSHIVKLMTVDPKHCNVFCLKAIQDKLSLILSKNLQIFLGKTIPCNVGTYSEDGISHCKRCPPGTYQPNHGARVCRTCTNPMTKGCYNMLWNSFSAVMVTLASIGAMLSICLLSLWIICCAKKKFCVKRMAGFIVRENTFEGEKHVEEQPLIKDASENEDQQWDSEYRIKKKKGKFYLHEDEWGSHRIKNVPIISPDSYRSHEDYNNHYPKRSCRKGPRLPECDFDT